MKRFFVFILLLISSYGAIAQSWTNIYGRQRFATGLSIPVKDSTAFQGSADTSLIYVNPSNGGIYYRYKTNHIRLGTGGGGSGTVTSVDMSVPTGFAISGSPITTAGTLGLSFASGYSLPTNANQTNWTTAYTNRITSLTTTGNSGSATLVSNVLNIPTYTLAGLGGISATYLSGTPPISYNSGTGVISISQATTSTNGYLSSTDWNTFNSKQNALTFGNLTEATSSVLTITGGTNAVIGSGTSLQVKQASGSQSGFLSSTDWATFNNKQNLLNGTGFVKATGTTISYDTTSYVPYINATKNVNLGEYGLSSGFIKYDTTPTGTPTAQGTTYWDVNEETVALIMNGTTLRIGEDLYYPVKNKTGSTIPKGTAVRFAGTVGSSGRLLIAPFIGNATYPSKYFMGVTSENIANGANGQVMAFGKIRKVNTSAYVDGDILYTSTTTSGGFQTTAPVAPNNIISVALVVLADATNGEILVRPQIGSKLSDDENVLFSSLTNNDVLTYETSTSLWKNKSIPTALGYTPVPNTRTISTTAPLAGGGDLTTNRTLSITQSSSTVDGYLSATDWRTFSNKQDTLKLTTTGSSGSSTYNPTTETLNVPTYTLAGLGGISLTSLSASSPLTYNNTTGAFSISLANGSTNGYLSSTNWRTFNNKQDTLKLTTTGSSGASTYNPATETLNVPTYTLAGLGGISLTSLSATSPLSYNNTTGAFSISQATGSTNGYLSSTDWTTFNAKQGALTLTTTGTSGAATLIGNTLNIPNYASGGITGSGATGQATFWTGTNTVSGDNGFFWDNTNKRLGLGTTTPTHILQTTTDIKVNGVLIGAGTSGSYNTRVGFDSFISNTTGGSNTAIGSVSLIANTTGSANTAVGESSGYYNTTGSDNSFFGQNSGYYNTTGNYNSFFGRQSGLASNASRNAFFGFNSGLSTSSGGDNAFFGTESGRSNTTGATNAFFGNNAGFSIISGSNNVFLGYNADSGFNTASNQIAIGANANGLGANTTVLGNSSTSYSAIFGNLLLGTTTNENTALLNMVSTTKGLLKPRMTTTQRDAITSPATGLEIFNTTTGVPNYYNGSAWTATGTGSGTVTSVAALTLGTTGTDLSSTVANGTTTPVITLNVPTASATNRGVLSSTDWSTFNGKQNALSGTGFVKISGTTISYDNSTYLTTSSAASTYQPLLSLTTGYIPKATGTSTLGNSLIYDNGSGIGIGTTSISSRALYVVHNSAGNFAQTIQQNNATGLGLQIYANTSGWGGRPFDILSNSGLIFYVDTSGGITSHGASTFSSSVTASSFVQSGGTSSQYLMADGSTSTLTNPVTGTGTTNYLTKWSSSSAVGNSAIYDAGSNVLGIGTTSPLIATSRQGMVIRGGSTGAELVLQSTNSTNGTYDGLSMAIDGDIAYLYNKRNGNLQLGANNALKATLKTNGDFDITGAYLVNGVPISTGGITGTLTSGYVPKATGTSTVGNSGLYDASGNVLGLGTTSPALFTGRQGLVIRGSSAGAELVLQSTNSTNGAYEGLSLAMDGDVAYIFNKRNGDLQLGANNARRATLTVGGDFDITGTYKVNGVALSSGVGGSGTSGYMPKFATSTTLGNSLLYDDGAKITYGSTTANAVNTITFNKITANESYININAAGAGGSKTAMQFQNSSTTVGSITTSSTTTTYSTSSDYRLKTDFKQFDGIALINKINVYNYAWKINNERSFGVKAHELQEIIPYAVTGKKDGENMQGVDYSKIVPILVQAIKDQQKEIELLKTKIK